MRYSFRWLKAQVRKRPIDARTHRGDVGPARGIDRHDDPLQDQLVAFFGGGLGRHAIDYVKT